MPSLQELVQLYALYKSVTPTGWNGEIGDEGVSDVPAGHVVGVQEESHLHVLELPSLQAFEQVYVA